METENISLRCKIASSNPTHPLSITVLLDQQVLYTNPQFTDSINFEKIISDADGEHELQFVLSGKTSEMTKIDEQGNITEDVMIDISHLTFDDIDLVRIVPDVCVYEHDFNGTGKTVQEKFFGTMGCNGKVTLKFNTPVYLWLLENM